MGINQTGDLVGFAALGHHLQLLARIRAQRRAADPARDHQVIADLWPWYNATLASTLQQIFAKSPAGAKTQAQVPQVIVDVIDAFVKSGNGTAMVTGADSLGGTVIGARTGSVSWHIG